MEVEYGALDFQSHDYGRKGDWYDVFVCHQNPPKTQGRINGNGSYNSCQFFKPLVQFEKFHIDERNPLRSMTLPRTKIQKRHERGSFCAKKHISIFWWPQKKESIHNFSQSKKGRTFLKRLFQFLVKPPPSQKKKRSNINLGGGGFIFFNVHPYLGKMSILTLIFFRWVETAN